MMKPIFKILVLCVSIVLLLACEAPEDVNIIPPEEAANEAQIEPLAPIKPVLPSVKNNYGYEFVEEMHNMQRLSRLAIRKYQKIAIVQDVNITYPEWPFGDPVDPDDGFVSGMRRYEIKLIQALRGDLPENFSYEIYSEAGKFSLKENAYPLAFCFSEVTQSYVAREIEGQMFDDPGFLQLFLDEWDKAEPVDLSDKPCWFDVDD